MEVERVFGKSESKPHPLSGRMSETLFNAVHQAIGHASMCWSDTDHAGCFNALEAGDIALELCNLIADEIG